MYCDLCYTNVMKNSTIEISKRLKKARVDAGYRSARAFAQKNDFQYITYSQHEAGKRKIRAETIVTYAEKLNVDPAWLFTGKTFAYEINKDMDDSQSLLPTQKHSNFINPNLLTNIFEELERITTIANITLSNKDKILISTEIYNNTINSENKNFTITSLLDTVLNLIEKILKGKVA